MRRILALCCSGTALATAGWAQESSAPPILVPAAAAPSAAASGPASTPAPSRATEKPQSSDLNAMLSASMPQYAPPAPPKPEVTEDSPDLRDVDKPRNRIIRLPKYTVHAEKPPIFREQDIYTADGITRLAMMRYSGLGMVPLAGMNSGVANEMYRENQRLNNMSMLEDTAASMQRGGDKDEAKMIREASQSTYQQSLDWGATGGIRQNPSAYGANGLR